MRQQRMTQAPLVILESEHHSSQRPAVAHPYNQQERVRGWVLPPVQQGHLSALARGLLRLVAQEYVQHAADEEHL